MLFCVCNGIFPPFHEYQSKEIPLLPRSEVGEMVILLIMFYQFYIPPFLSIGGKLRRILKPRLTKRSQTSKQTDKDQTQTPGTFVHVSVGCILHTCAYFVLFLCLCMMSCFCCSGSMAAHMQRLFGLLSPPFFFAPVFSCPFACRGVVVLLWSASPVNLFRRGSLETATSFLR